VARSTNVPEPGRAHGERSSERDVPVHLPAIEAAGRRRARRLRQHPGVIEGAGLGGIEHARGVEDRPRSLARPRAGGLTRAPRVEPALSAPDVSTNASGRAPRAIPFAARNTPLLVPMTVTGRLIAAIYSTALPRSVLASTSVKSSRPWSPECARAISAARAAGRWCQAVSSSPAGASRLVL
jgi:hypothetical protein